MSINVLLMRRHPTCTYHSIDPLPCFVIEKMDVGTVALDGDPITDLNFGRSREFDSDQFFCPGVEITKGLASEPFHHHQFTAEPRLRRVTHG